MAGVSLISGAVNAEAVYGASNRMAASERDILARERALAASAPGASTHTFYRYEIGPDGRRYIVGAEVSMIAPEDELASIPGTKHEAAGRGAVSREKPYRPEISKDARADEETSRLERTEREVIAHENAHKAAAGRFGGPVSYTYTTGPDGKRYITGGEVPIHTPATSDPEEALSNARQVMRAATAPADPSGQDIAVAASAAAMASNARADLAREGDGEGAKRAGNSAREITRAYSENGSPKGLWSRTEGFGKISGEDEDTLPQNIPKLDIAV
jgi:hypothetical protein